MNIKLNNNTPKELIIKNHLEEEIKRININELNDVDKGIISGFCMENPFRLIQVNELNLLYTVYISTDETLGDSKEITGIKSTTEKIIKTSLFLDLFSKILTEE